ncbi:sodium:proton antiporter [Massilia sp. CF038]|uniref:cation:proton antiporter n=1 Tax=Massilia sp. CF038 TaxID=1881045 RepID=UPI0009170EA2|nr:cation:proton antiporter [Massilia sp. CF038]SHH67644.1 sodium/proton antiporter, CPA1 family [Massilia sp. CF038]
MTTTHWFILIGCLMLARGLAATTISRSPFTSAIVYLCVGLLLGPMVLGFFRFNPIEESHLLETLTEVAVLVSLFSAGVKMPVPITRQRWAPAIRLAWVSMSISVGLVAAFAYYVLHLPLGVGVLLGAILAPTDPVLATDIQVRHADDRDQLRNTLTCEAGMNDGSAFPFVMLGLGLLGAHELGPYGMGWVLVDVLWATFGAIGIGALGGAALGKLSWMLRGRDPKHEVLDDFVGLGLIAVVYGLCVVCKAWGFLAVFFAGVALRQTELVLSGAHKDRQGLLVTEDGQQDPQESTRTVSAESLVFKEHIERLSELTLVLLLGGMVSFQNWNWDTIGMAAFLFIVARPVSVMLGLIGSSSSMRVRGITGWFGVRGIGSIYYLMFAINHGLPRNFAQDLIQITVVVVMLSIVVHGTSVKPLFDRFWPKRKQEK